MGPFLKWDIHPRLIHDMIDSEEMNENVLNVGNLQKIVARKPMGMAPDRFQWKLKD